MQRSFLFITCVLSLVVGGYAQCDPCSKRYNACASVCYDKAFYPICVDIQSPAPGQPPKYVPPQKLFASYCDMNCWLDAYAKYNEVSSTTVLYHQFGMEQNGCKRNLEDTRYAFVVENKGIFPQIPAFAASKMGQGKKPRDYFDEMLAYEQECFICDEKLRSDEPLLTSDPPLNTSPPGRPL